MVTLASPSSFVIFCVVIFAIGVIIGALIGSEVEAKHWARMCNDRLIHFRGRLYVVSPGPVLGAKSVESGQKSATN